MDRLLRGGALALLSLALLSTGCMGGVKLQVLASAPVTVPPSVQKVAVVDRSTPRNAGQGFLDALEGALTGEDIMADRDGAQAAVQAVERALIDSPRFEVVGAPGLSRRDLESSPDDRPASWPLIDRICKQAGCDGVVSLEMFDSDTGGIQFPSTQASSGSSSQNVRGSREARVTVTIRFYDARQHQVVDEMVRRRIDETFTAEGETPEQVRNNLANVRSQLTKLGQEVGAAYGRRVAPSYVWVSRSYYTRGHPLLQDAKRHVRASDWAGAVRIWSQLAGETGDPKLKGKAHFNLALASERTGDLDHAVELAQQAAVELANGRARSYQTALERRRADARRLDAQMETAQPAPAAPTTPQPVQPTQPAGRGPL
ncbi:MAG: DUF6340 family protein [Deltaproteobacteria bacterium]|nr:DUF6340 family protein [Deltaproteobacteria bacterium]